MAASSSSRTKYKPASSSSSSSSKFNLSPSVHFSIDRPISPHRSISAVNHHTSQICKKRVCMCSPTTHPGSFRCNLHKKRNRSDSPYVANRLNARRSAMTNSLVRIGSAEGDLLKRALAALIRPSSHHQRRRVGFKPRTTRLSIMSKV